ncbi:MAG: Xaa-Pro peptidase family protein [Eubacteriales bacterium]|nr:Xaa-Pro peptidase family protein [Eubacteriales bacterium]
MNREKIANLVNENSCDAVLLLNESNMHYACGFSPSEGVVVITSSGEGYHIVDSRYTETAQAHAENTGFKVIEIQGKFTDEVKNVCQKHNVKRILFENDTILLSRYNAYKNALEGVEFKELSNQLMLLRNEKEPWEINLIKDANNIAEKSFLELLPEVKAGKTEKELASLFDYLMAKNGSDGVSFDTILLTGEHTSMPHGVPSDRKIQDGDFVLFDFGATCQGYHSDMTRTVAVGYATDEMHECYNLVLKAQKAGIQALESGAKCADVYKAAYDVLDEKDMAKYFRHSLGHGVGLDIHEGFNASPRSTDTFNVGNVTSIEPGIYIPNKFGIRIEDLLYISPRGRENLSKITKELIVLK